MRTRAHTQAALIDAFDQIRNRLIAWGASDHFVTDFGPVLSVFFRDPDGPEGEVCIQNPDAVPGVHNPPGTPRGVPVGIGYRVAELWDFCGTRRSP